MHVAWSGEIKPNASVVAVSLICPSAETWDLNLLSIEHKGDEGPGSVEANVFVTPAKGTRARTHNFAGTEPMQRYPLHGQVDPGEKLEVELTARHHDHPCKVTATVSYARTAFTLKV